IHTPPSKWTTQVRSLSTAGCLSHTDTHTHTHTCLLKKAISTDNTHTSSMDTPDTHTRTYGHEHTHTHTHTLSLSGAPLATSLDVIHSRQVCEEKVKYLTCAFSSPSHYLSEATVS